MLGRLSQSVSVATRKTCMRAMGTYKTSTGLVGLAVDPNGRETLMHLSADVLKSVQRIPSDAQYRINVESWFKHIHDTCKTTEDIKKIEETLELGQIEEVIENAKDELKLVDYYFDNKGWELVAASQAEADKMVLAMADSIYFTDPDNHPARVIEDK